MVTPFPLLVIGLGETFHLVWPMRHEGTYDGDEGFRETDDIRCQGRCALFLHLELTCPPATSVAVWLSCARDNSLMIVQQAKGDKAERGGTRSLMLVRRWINHSWSFAPGYVLWNNTFSLLFTTVWVGIFCYWFPKAFCFHKQCRSLLHFWVSPAPSPQIPAAEEESEAGNTGK